MNSTKSNAPDAPAAAEQRRFLTVEDVGRELHLTASTVRDLLRSGDLAGFQVGPRGLWRVESTELDAYVERQKARARAGRER